MRSTRNAAAHPRSHAETGSAAAERRGVASESAHPPVQCACCRAPCHTVETLCLLCATQRLIDAGKRCNHARSTLGPDLQALVLRHDAATVPCASAATARSGLCTRQTDSSTCSADIAMLAAAGTVCKLEILDSGADRHARERASAERAPCPLAAKRPCPALAVHSVGATPHAAPRPTRSAVLAARQRQVECCADVRSVPAAAVPVRCCKRDGCPMAQQGGRPACRLCAVLRRHKRRHACASSAEFIALPPHREFEQHAAQISAHVRRTLREQRGVFSEPLHRLGKDLGCERPKLCDSGVLWKLLLTERHMRDFRPQCNRQAATANGSTPSAPRQRGADAASPRLRALHSEYDVGGVTGPTHSGGTQQPASPSHLRSRSHASREMSLRQPRAQPHLADRIALRKTTPALSTGSCEHALPGWDAEVKPLPATVALKRELP